MPEPLIVVTGGTGFIGTHVVARLAARGARVRLFSRRIGTSAGRRKAGKRVTGAGKGATEAVELMGGDVTDLAAVLRALDGAAIVYHLAGCARAWVRDQREFQAVNGRGTENICRAAQEHGIARLVHVSTNLVDAEHAADRARVALTAYQRSKREGEHAVRKYLEAGGDAIIVRPTRVYGPGIMSQSNSVTRLIDLYRRGLFRFRIADRDARANYVYVDDVVEGILLAGRHGAVGGAGAVYTLGGENATMPQFLAAIADATGTHRTVNSLPKGLAKFLAAGFEALAYAGIDPLVTRDWVELVTRDWPATSDPARAELGYDPRCIADGVRTTVQWLEAGRPSPFSATQAEWQSA